MARQLKVPSVGESVTEVEIGDWLKREGDSVAQDENVVVIETDKATVEIAAPAAGRLGKILKQKGARVTVGEVVGSIEEGAPAAANDATPAQPSAPAKDTVSKAPAESKTSKPKSAAEAPEAGQAKPTPPAAKRAAPQSETAPSPTARVMPAAARLMAEKGLTPEDVPPTGPGGRILKEDVQRAATQPDVTAAAAVDEPAPSPRPAGTAPATGAREEEVVPMSLLRRKIAQRLVQAQQDGALLTTFNEIDLSQVMGLRRQYQEAFQQRYQIKLGFMSFFVKAVIEGLKEIPALNAVVRGTDIVYRHYHDIGVAIGGGRGLVVPVLRDAGHLSLAEIEQAIADFAQRAKANKIKPDDLAGGTFTITNGGVYGSLLSTPIINPPQSGVLGMHAIQERPIAMDGQVVIRPMMYVALTYDHRVVDGREAVTFLRRVKELVEQPARILMEV